MDELLGIEGNAARLYFGEFAGMIKVDEAEDVPEQFRFHFSHRNRRPPRDAVNALLSLAYSLLAKDSTIACYAVGFDPMIGFYHQPRFGRPALALDLMEPFRPLIADSAVLSGNQYTNGEAKGFYYSGSGSGVDSCWKKGILPSLRAANGHDGDTSAIRLQGQLPPIA
jgi:CRISPR-associated endonuclease Cas1